MSQNLSRVLRAVLLSASLLVCFLLDPRPGAVVVSYIAFVLGRVVNSYVHELGHAAAALVFRWRIMEFSVRAGNRQRGITMGGVRVRLGFIGSVSHVMVKYRTGVVLSRSRRIAFAAAGPIANIAFGGVTLLIASWDSAITSAGDPPLSHAALVAAGAAACAMGVANLMPGRISAGRNTDGATILLVFRPARAHGRLESTRQWNLVRDRSGGPPPADIVAALRGRVVNGPAPILAATTLLVLGMRSGEFASDAPQALTAVRAAAADDREASELAAKIAQYLAVTTLKSLSADPDVVALAVASAELGFTRHPSLPAVRVGMAMAWLLRDLPIEARRVLVGLDRERMSVSQRNDVLAAQAVVEAIADNVERAQELIGGATVDGSAANGAPYALLTFATAMVASTPLRDGAFRPDSVRR